MRKIQAILCAMLLVLGTVGMSHAAPYIYTLSGYVYDGVTMDDTAGLIAAAGISYDDPVEYRWLIDFEADGYRVMNNGTMVVMVDNPATNQDFFYAEYLSGSMIGVGGEGCHTEPTQDADRVYGVDLLSSGQGFAQAGSEDDRQVIFSAWSLVRDLSVGDSVYVFEQSWDEDCDQSIFYALCDVSSIEAVPIPGAVWLLGSGLIGIVGIRRKFKK